MISHNPHRSQRVRWPKTPGEAAIAAEMEETGLDRLPAIRRIQQRVALGGRR